MLVQNYNLPLISIKNILLLKIKQITCTTSIKMLNFQSIRGNDRNIESLKLRSQPHISISRSSIK